MQAMLTYFIDEAAVMEAVRDGIARGMSRTGFAVREEVQRLIQPRVMVSRPGKPPTDQTGRLKRSIRYDVDGQRKSVVVGPVGLASRSRNAVKALEFGGVSTNSKGQQRRVEARPFMRPAFEFVLRSKVPSVFADVIR